MSYRNTRLGPSPDARIRPLPEWGRCLVYATADRPELYDLNTTAWLVLELCTAMEEGDARDAFRATLAPRIGTHEALRQFDEGLERLLETGILERAPPATASVPDHPVATRSCAR